MMIRDVETFVLKLAADEAYLGRLPDGSEVPAAYTVREPWRSLYSARYETLLVKVVADRQKDSRGRMRSRFLKRGSSYAFEP